MAQRGKPSTAHVYDARQQCIYCGMYEWNVVALSHVCTVAREAFTDLQSVAAGKATLKEVKDGQ